MGGIRVSLNNIRYRLKFVLSGDCGHACGILHPWGFVPEEGCTVHYIRPKWRTVYPVDTTVGSGIVVDTEYWPIT